MCIEYVKHGDCIVDFSCGDNAWISSMIERSEEKGLDFLTFKCASFNHFANVGTGNQQGVIGCFAGVMIRSL